MTSRPPAAPRRQAERRRHQRNNRAENLSARYGITLEQFEAMARAQRWRCKLCSVKAPKPKNGERHALHVDHEHATGRVRALLCARCNGSLPGHADAAWFAKVAVYLADTFDGRMIVTEPPSSSFVSVLGQDGQLYHAECPPHLRSQLEKVAVGTQVRITYVGVEKGRRRFSVLKTNKP